MAGGKLSPRQQMINMMYLVLTALLAMNVSKEILDAFITIDKGQKNTTLALDGKIGQQMAAFSASANENKDKYGPAFAKAQKIDETADEIFSHINEIKAKLIMAVEGYETKSEVLSNDTVLDILYINNKDNYDEPTRIMYGSDEKNPIEGPCQVGCDMDYSAVGLRKKLMTYATDITSDIDDPKLKASINDMFKFENVLDADRKEISWEFMNFNGVPLAGVVTILSKLQSDVKSAQASALDFLYAEVEGASYKFTKLADAVIPQATTITTGSNYEAEVFLAAYDDQNVPEIRLGRPGVRFDSTKMELTGEYDLLEMEGVKGKIKLPAGGLGSQKREGMIIFKPVGQPEVITPFNLDYTVVAPTLVVSPTKMNVFYRGVDNPVSVGVPGFTDKDITASCEGCTINKASDGYIVRVSTGKEAKIYANAKLPDGGSKRLGPATFRIKSVPDPVPQFAGKGAADAIVKKAELTAAQGVVAKMKDFEFDLKFTVTQFKIGMIIGGQYVEQTSKSNRVTDDMKTMIKKAKRGQKVFIEGIKAKGPDGKIRNLGSLAFKVN
ncbi:MAG: gliding motility protein GldM [Flavobacteriales bacterium]|nr:gliding motility protein GldM [Flavobacteriales bacterium]